MKVRFLISTFIQWTFCGIRLIDQPCCREKGQRTAFVTKARKGKSREEIEQREDIKTTTNGGIVMRSNFQPLKSGKSRASGFDAKMSMGNDCRYLTYSFSRGWDSGHLTQFLTESALLTYKASGASVWKVPRYVFLHATRLTLSALVPFPCIWKFALPTVGRPVSIWEKSTLDFACLSVV